MPTTIAFLTPGMELKERTDLAEKFSRYLDKETTLLCFDPFTDEGRSKALHALTSGQVEAAVSLDAKRFKSHVLVDSRVPVVVVPRNPDQIWRAVEIVAAVRARGVNCSVALSWDEAAERIRAIFSPPVLSGLVATIVCRDFAVASSFLMGTG